MKTNTIFLENFKRFEEGTTPKGYNIKNPDYAEVVEISGLGRALHMAGGKIGSIETGEKIADRIEGKIGIYATLRGDKSEPLVVVLGIKSGYKKKKIIEIEENKFIINGKVYAEVSNSDVISLCAIVDTKTGEVSYYIDGKLVAENIYITNICNWCDGIYFIKNGSGELYLGGIRMYYGEEPEAILEDEAFVDYTTSLFIDQAPHDFAFFHTSDINAGEKRVQATAFGAEDGTTCEMQMLDYWDSFKGDKLVFTKEENSGDAKAFYRTDTKKMHSNWFPILDSYPYYVTRGRFTADMTAEGILAGIDCVTVFGKETVFEALCLKQGGYIETNNGVRSEKLNFKSVSGEDIWHEVAVYFNMAERTCDVILDEEVLSVDMPMPKDLVHISGFTSSINGGYGTIKLWKWTDIGLQRQPERTEVNGKVTKVSINHLSQFPLERNLVEYLKDKIVFHGEARRMYFDGRKHTMDVEACWDKDNKELYISAADFKAAFGIDADGPVPVCKMAEELGRFARAYEYGNMVIVSNDKDLPREGAIDAEPWKYVYSAFYDAQFTEQPWNDYPLYILSNAQLIADFILYDRPTPEQLIEDYNKKTKSATHPKIMLTAEKVEQLKGYLKEDKVFQGFWRGIEAAAEEAMNEGEIFLYPEAARDPDHHGHKDTSGDGRKFLLRQAALGMIYQVTGEEKYAQKAKERSIRVSQFTDYNIQKSIDPGFWMGGVALGLDWCWDVFTPEERKSVLDGIIYAGLEPTDRIMDALNAGCHVSNEDEMIGLMFQYDSYYPKWASNYYPFNMGGVSIACAMAMEEHPEFAARLMAKIIRGWEYCFKVIYPTGAWTESPAYGDNVGRGFAWGIGSLEGLFGKTYNLENAPGLSKFIEADMYQSSWRGAFGWADCDNYNDTVFDHIGCFAGFAAQMYQRPDFMQWRLKKLEAVPTAAEFMDVLYYIPQNDDGPFRNLSHIYHEAGTELVAMHQDWNDKDGGVFFMTGGAAHHYHRHDDGGDFMIISQGECWTYELGTGYYNVGGTAYNKYLGRTEGHNTITINPDSDPGFSDTVGIWNYTYTNQYPKSMIKATKWEADEFGGTAVFDMTEAYHQHGVSKMMRGAKVSDGYKTFTIRDEITFDAHGDGWWFMHTDAELTQVDDKTIVMKKNGKKMIVTFECTADHSEMSPCDAVLLPTSPKVGGDPTNTSKVRKVGIYFSGRGKIELTVRISAFDGEIDILPIDKW